MPKPLPGVVLAHLRADGVAGAFHDSVCNILMVDAARGVGHSRIIGGVGGGLIGLSSGPRVAESRSKVVETFLTDPTFEGAEYLWMLDSDMTFDPEVLDLLLETAEDNDADVVGGLCFAGGRSRMYPTLYRLWREGGGYNMEPVEDYPRDTVVRVGATGAACILIRRRVLLALTRAHPGGFGTTPDGQPNPYPWFVEGHTTVDGKPLGEDIAFCIRVNGIGGTVFVDTRAKVGHVKTLVLDEALWDDRQRAKQRSMDSLSDLLDAGRAQAPGAADLSDVRA